ncbi:nuclear transport factor 2 family protein [Cupriavidus basilensis]
MTIDMTMAANKSADMKAALLDYVAAFNAADAERVAALFADDATVEDPVGGPMIAGRESILAFYRHATSLGARLEVVAAPGVRTAMPRPCVLRCMCGCRGSRYASM